MSIPSRLTVSGIAAIVSAIAAFYPSAGVTAPPTVDEMLKIEKGIIDSRMKIVAGKVIVLVRPTIKNGAHVDGNVRGYELYFDGEMGRADLEVAVGGAILKTREVYTRDVFIRDDSASKSVQVFGASTRPKATIDIPDARRLGLVAWFFESIDQFGLETHFLRMDRADIHTGLADQGGVRVIKVQYRIPFAGGAIDEEYWLAPEMGNMPIFISAASGDPPNRVSQSIKSTYRFIEPGGIWFPIQVRFTSRRGESVVDEEVDDVELADFGPIDPSLFTIGGLKLKPGRVVNSDGKVSAWDGAKLTAPAQCPEPDNRNPKSDSTRFWLLVLNAIVLALLCAAILWYRWRAKRPSS